MALISRADALRPVLSHSPRIDTFLEGDPFDLNSFEEELKRLAVANDELLADLNTDDAEEELESTRPTREPMSHVGELVKLQQENAELKARLHDLESAGAGEGEDVWLERQREYEMLLEEKSEVIRSLHQKVQDLQEAGGPAQGTSSGGGRGQAEEILRLKREMEDQRRQLDQDEVDMMAQLRQMEMTMAKERAEMARQRQEVARLQADLAHEIEHASRDSGLKERLQNLRRTPGGSKPTLQPPTSVKPEAHAAPAEPHSQNSSGFFRRIFG